MSLALVALVGVLGVRVGWSQGIGVTTQQQTTGVQPGSDASAAGAPQGVVLDRVVAVVNSELVLESDVEEERRFAVFQPLTSGGEGFSRRTAIERMINRALILQQLKLQPQPAITDKAVDAQLAQLRKDIPECKQFHCEADAGWAKFVAAQGLTLPELQERWRTRMEVLRFIEQRFQMGIRISPEEIKTYYDKTLLPEYAKRKVSPPKLETISDRIQEVLLQQRVSSLLADWLKTLKAQGSVRILGEGGGVAGQNVGAAGEVGGVTQ